MDERLNVELVKKLRMEKGPTVRWLIEHVGLGETAGYLMFRKGLLPEDSERRKTVLEKLAAYLGTEVRQILLSPPRSRKTA